jgi:hypothetical protein
MSNKKIKHAEFSFIPLQTTQIKKEIAVSKKKLARQPSIHIAYAANRIIEYFFIHFVHV